MSRFGNIGHRLFTGELSFDFVGRRKLWVALSGVIVLAAILGLSLRGLNLGIEFKGGEIYTISKPGVTVSQAQDVANKITGDNSSVVQSSSSSSGKQITIQISAAENVTTEKAITEITSQLGVPANQVSTQMIGASWGQDISKKALYGIIAFMVLVTLYLAVAFEWRLAVGALVALLHDMVITVGVYALLGFTVTSGTVIGFLTVLGYSLYDTVVVFDGLKDATKKLGTQSRLNYSDAANQSLNSTLVRSINTTILALLPVAALLFIGGGLLGAGTLNDISLALFVGLSAGAYSSICVATPMVAWLKEKQPENIALAKKVRQRRAAEAKAAAEGVVLDQADRAGQDDEAAEGNVPVSSGSGAGGSTGPRRQPVNRSRNDRRAPGKRK
ncbi:MULTISPECIES: protein translocase subunit SecF [Streptacidiphilus]|uniref:Protein-export membrane protein SecF n=2 Tax=Streptacidiphilus TaxID=228398 RepID=A0ABV6UTE2_9ACTN|nr:protein translocase subunit SecF [Streptacidiphilus jeojiense]